MMPLDVHVARVGRELGLITRQGNDRKTVEELTRNLAVFDPKDPCRYDLRCSVSVNHKNTSSDERSVLFPT